MNRYLLVFLFSLISLSSCVTLIKDEEVDTIKKYEEGTYILKTNLTDNMGNSLSKGTRVKLISKTTNEYVKFYAYSANEPLLESKRFLLLYLFQEDFPIDGTEKKKKLQYGSKMKVDKNDKTRYVNENYQGEDLNEKEQNFYDYENYQFSLEKLEKRLYNVVEPDKSSVKDSKTK
ncbi:MAG TPA: hypothetical protein PK419_07645 [Spirochaetota bacterium]|jgi:type II secretion system-associated lipoprotein|nr:hypothetical protein [Spirochaetota bacterium]HOA08381.1 hypothetical protein [Spirochaetota bacterium]HPY03186.1 hypothetical protein [Spirochaetota bacterium]HQA52714.1 hypothetical protein [Spirochaetota bacterium]